MASFIKKATKNGARWKAVVKAGGPRISKTFRLKRHAEDWAKRVEHAREIAGVAGVTEAVTCKQLCDEYARRWTGRDRGQMGRVQWWRESLDNLPLLELSVAIVKAHLAAYAGGKAQRWDGPGKVASTTRQRAPASVNRMSSTLAAMLKYAVAQGWLHESPMVGMPRLAEKNARRRYLEGDEQARLLAACKASPCERLHLLVVMAIATGARQGELLQLRWTDLDLKKRQALVRLTKTDEPRLLSLPRPVVRLLDQYREVGNGRVFPGNKRKTAPLEFRKPWNQALADAGIENSRFHDLRHTAASYLANQGKTLLEIGEVLGHKSTQTTKRYSHLSEKRIQEITDETMEAYLGDIE